MMQSTESKPRSGSIDQSYIESENILKEGWLHILIKKKWERRYFVLKNGNSMLNYFKTPKDRTKGGIIHLFLSSCSQASIKGHKYTFQLISRAENFMFKADSIEEMNSWILSIQELCQSLLSAGLDNDEELHRLSLMSNNNSSTTPDEHTLQDEEGHNTNPSPSIGEESTQSTVTINTNTGGGAPVTSGGHHNSGNSGANIFSWALSDKNRSFGRDLSRKSESRGSEFAKKPLVSITDLIKRSPYCCDCSRDLSEGNEYVSLLLGSFICGDCASLHHSMLGNQISDVKALNNIDKDLDIPLFDQSAEPMAMTFLSYMGNKKVNDYWEAAIPELVVKPLGNASLSDKKHWIYEKYIKKTFKGCKQGYLFVKSNEKKKLKRFWVVLGDSGLHIYSCRDGKKETKEREVIQLSSCGVKIGDDPAEPECFSIITPGKKYKVRAVTYPAALEWANAVRVAAASLVLSLSAPAAKSASIKKRDLRRASRLVDASEMHYANSSSLPISTSSSQPQSQSQPPLSDWLQLKSDLLIYEEKLQDQENEIIEHENRILRCKEIRNELIEERYEKAKELYAKKADWDYNNPPIDQMSSPLINHSTSPQQPQQQQPFHLLSFQQLMSSWTIPNQTPPSPPQPSPTPSSLPSTPQGGNQRSSTHQKLVKHTRTSMVLAANSEGFVHHLVFCPEDKTFMHEFILSYRSFMTPSRFLSELAELFNNSDVEAKTNIIKLMEQWITQYYSDLNGDFDALRHIIAFIQFILHPLGFSDQSNRFLIILRNQVKSGLTQEKALREECPEPIIPNTLLIQPTLLDVDELEVARQLCLIDQTLFRSIYPREFLNRGWLQEDKSTESPNLIALLEQFNKRVNWVLTSILTLDRKKRSLMLGKFIQIAKHCATLRNYNAAMQIITAIEDNIILKFDGTWEMVHQKNIPILLDLRKLLSKANNFSNLKQELFNLEEGVPSIPYLQIYIDEILAIEVDFPDYVNNLINFEKRRKVSRLIIEIQKLQSPLYSLLPVPSIQLLLLNSPILTMDQLLNFATLTQQREIAEDLLNLPSYSPLPPWYLPPDVAPSPPSDE